ncbi:conjugal transfer protein TraF [Zhongshania aquimaris]|uniref:Conjugal transfer protein TraF n=1 Tax=Zhongshania aquimaris TaxID=2857107 RepID=A0ABS6VUV9_9GAMM|nr:conjugal transfer protein TraF [Zhongshania aquimaris]MBW2942108.1 conjugal transfer protein TraF [Zhongshania aquimaris]
MNTLLPIFSELRLRQILLICIALISTHVTADSASDQRLSNLHTRSASFPAINSHSEPALQGDGYGFVNDADSLLDNLKNIYDEGVALDGRSRGILVIPGDETELVEQLENADNDITSFAAGGHFALLTQDKNWVVVGGSEFNGSGRFIYDEGDANRLRFATILGLFSLGDLQSSVNVSALWKNYLGLNYRFSLESMPNTRIGITAKLQNISVIERKISIEDYDEDKLFDRGRDVENSIQANADLGIEHQIDNWLFGLELNDIYQQEIEGPEGTRYQQRTHISGNINYSANWASLRLDADLSPQKGFGELSSRRAYALSGLLPVSDKLQLLLGYTWLHSGNDSNLPTVGLHYRLGELLRIEAQFSYAGPREFGGGASLQLPL